MNGTRNKEEQNVFFHQQTAIAEMMHPNIARHFAICDQGIHLTIIL